MYIASDNKMPDGLKTAYASTCEVTWSTITLQKYCKIYKHYIKKQFCDEHNCLSQNIYYINIYNFMFLQLNYVL